jgi:RNA polymerase sigma-70 factor (ECF subfamily)
MAPNDADSEELLTRACRGDSAAQQELLGRHGKRLRKMVAARLDRRLAARIDPSDVVQEALLDASRLLPKYLRERPLPFYPWLRRLAWKRLVKLQQRHLGAQKRSVTREEQQMPLLPEESALELAERLVAPGTSPSNHALREELRGRVQAALTRLPEHYREVLVLRFLEELSTSEMAAVLEITEAAVKTRQTRALDRLSRSLSACSYRRCRRSARRLAGSNVRTI